MGRPGQNAMNACEIQRAWIQHLQARGLLEAEQPVIDRLKPEEKFPEQKSPDADISKELLDGASSMCEETRAICEEVSDPPNSGSVNGDGSANSKAFTAEENDLITACVAQFCEQYKLNASEFSSLLWYKQDNKYLRSLFWKQLKVGNRSASSVHKRVHRMYLKPALTERWTRASDEQLTRLVQHFGAASWTIVALHMNRSPEACRDRWRNYLVCGPNRMSFAWSEEETARLVSIVQSLPAERINWGSVSAQMGHQRSRIQCRYRWNKVRPTAQ